MVETLFKISVLLFGSGMCSLIYEIVWSRELRLIFGEATTASAAVLVIFMGGLGLGGFVLGKRVQQSRNPLRFYAFLELGISLFAALTPVLLKLIRLLYIDLGGSFSLGIPLATLVRLGFSSLVVGIPTFLMGGTLPAAVMAVESEADVGRRSVGILYGINTLGAVLGSGISSFYLIERIGMQSSLWLAVVMNLALGLMGLFLSRNTHRRDEPSPTVPLTVTPQVPASFIMLSCGVIGFVFFLMEMVWYRMLASILGGSTYTFGLVLTVALFGIGLGGLLNSLRPNDRQATLSGFAFTCACEAFFLILPFALGDTLAVFTALLDPLRILGFEGKLIGWLLVTAVMVLPASIISGMQFPMLISLLGRGTEHIGHQTGMAYGWNTIGSIAGSLGGRFFFLPFLSAPKSWIFAVIVLILLSLAAIVHSFRSEKHRELLMLPALTCLLAGLFLHAQGPTAAWRHSPIGAGRVLFEKMDRNGVRDWMHHRRRSILWEVEGRESSLGVDCSNGLSFVLNGKCDGNTIQDSGTQIMSGMLGALFQGNPKKAFVVGLGTGCTAGWLGMIPGMERVDVIEMEEGVLEFARCCSAVNCNAMENEKVKIRIGDGREAILTTTEKYDLIISEPSNPYRSGVADLYTREFYEAVADHLEKKGLFCKWVQAYEVDAKTIQTIFATLRSVFPCIETWQTQNGDILLSCSMEEKTISVADLRKRMATEPYRSALLHAWGVVDLEGILARYIANTNFARHISELDLKSGQINTDDWNHVEFGFARMVGQKMHPILKEMRTVSKAISSRTPKIENGEVDWNLVDENRMILFTLDEINLPRSPLLSEDLLLRARAHRAFVTGDLEEVTDSWKKQKQPPKYAIEFLELSAALAEVGSETALPYLEKVMSSNPVESQAILARLRFKQGKEDECYQALEKAFLRYRVDPWVMSRIMTTSLETAERLAVEHPEFSRKVFDLLKDPFCLFSLNENRLLALLQVASIVGPEYGEMVLNSLEPNIFFSRKMLEYRLSCYTSMRNPLWRKAKEDLDDFMKNSMTTLSSE